VTPRLAVRRREVVDRRHVVARPGQHLVARRERTDDPVAVDLRERAVAGPERPRVPDVVSREPVVLRRLDDRCEDVVCSRETGGRLSGPDGPLLAADTHTPRSTEIKTVTTPVETD
jgi:hypothetical protein